MTPKGRNPAIILLVEDKLREKAFPIFETIPIGYGMNFAKPTGMRRNALGMAKAQGKVDPGDFKSLVSFLTRRIWGAFA